MTMAIAIFHVIKTPEQKLLVCRQLLVSLPFCTSNCIPVSPLGFIRRDIFPPALWLTKFRPLFAPPPSLLLSTVLIILYLRRQKM